MENTSAPDQLLAWLQHNKARLSLSYIEGEIGLPEKTLRHYVGGKRGLKDEHRAKVVTVLQDLVRDAPVA